MRPFWGPTRDPSSRTLGPAPHPHEADDATVYVPDPMFRGVGPASPEILAERDREQATLRRVEQVRTRLHAQSVDARVLVRQAARALVLAGGLTDAQVTSALVGLNNSLPDYDRLTVPDINGVVLELRAHVQAALAQPDGDLPGPA